ncbi:MAG: efflux RND transporter permease subunit [Planctomycetaceae bacterium]|nr:efflux RND transporter permease subunit [Planctomycetaceae bacterium]
MNLTRLAVHRPVSTLMACLIVVLMGGMSLSRLSIDLMPDVTFPTVSVTTVYEGAGPEEIETLITRPLEQALGSVHGVERLQSSSLEGSCNVRIQFAWGTDLDSAIGDIRAAIEKTRRNLPENIEPPWIRRFDVADAPIIYLGVASDLEPIALTRLAEKTIVPRLERVDGVAGVRVRGAIRREIQVDLDRGRLETLHMGVNEVVNALQRDNVTNPAGDFEEGNLNLLVRSRGDFRSVAEIEETVVRVHEGGIVRVKDVARVVDGEERKTELTRVNGKPGLLIYVNKQAGSGANTVAVSNSVRKAVDELNLQLRDAELSVRIDSAEFIRQAVQNIQQAAVLGMGLAVVVLILFLHSFRSTLVIGVSMPLAVLATFILMYFQGFTLNIVSFGGLALGIGMLVDNSIVVLESIFRRRELGQDRLVAAVEGTGEVTGAIVASTMTTLIVFLPLLFVQGITGVLLHQLAWVVSFSLLCSLMASVTLTPVLAAYWIGDEEVDSRQTGWYGLVYRFHHWNRSLFRGIERWYARLLGVTLRHSGLTAAALVLLCCVTAGLYPRIGSEYMPKTDEGDLRVSTEMAPGIQLDRLDEQSQQIEGTILEHAPEAHTVAAFIGGDADDADDWNRAWFRLSLSSRTDRNRTVEEIREKLSKQIGQVPGMKIQVQAQGGSMMTRMLTRRSGGGGGASLMVEVRGYDMDTADELAAEVARVMKEVSGLVNVKVERSKRRPELLARPNRTRANLLNVTVGDISETLETTIRGTRATVFREDGDEFSVLVRLQRSDRQQKADLFRVGVATADGHVVPLANLVDFAPGEAPVSINRLDRQRYVVVAADVADRELGFVVTDLQNRLHGLPLPEGFSVNIAGDWEEQQKSFAVLQTGFIMAVVLMYMIMAAQFESLIQPLLVLVAVPLGGIGVMAMLILTGTSLNVQSFIGLVMLAGIVVNNAIVLVDYVGQLRRSEPDVPLRELVIRGSERRFRPILMTTLTTVLAMIPVAAGWGEGGELQAPMARVVIGGLISGTLTTLLAIPLLLDWQGSFSRKLRPAAVSEQKPAAASSVMAGSAGN